MKKINTYLSVFTCTMVFFMALSFGTMNKRLEIIESRTSTKELVIKQHQALKTIEAEFEALNKKVDDLPK